MNQDDSGLIDMVLCAFFVFSIINLKSLRDNLLPVEGSGVSDNDELSLEVS